MSIRKLLGAFPGAAMPSDMSELDAMRRFVAGGIGVEGVEDDVTRAAGRRTRDRQRYSNVMVEWWGW
jgi:hypothetical protein